MKRRAALGLLIGGAAAVAAGEALLTRRRRGVRASEIAAAFERTEEGGVTRWLHGTLAAGASLVDVLDAAVVAGMAHADDDGDIHHLLAAGPAGRLAAGAEERDRVHLVLWTLLQGSIWLASTPTRALPDAVQGRAGPADRDAFVLAVRRRDADAAATALCRLGRGRDDAWRGALAEAASVQQPDPHSTIYASEASDLAARLTSHDRAALLASVARRLAQPIGDDADERMALVETIEDRSRELATRASVRSDADLAAVLEIARSVLSLGPVAAVDAVTSAAVAGASLSEIWAAVWVAAGSGAGQIGFPLNGIHAVTVTRALQRLADAAGTPQAAWSAALTAAARLSSDGPVVVLADVERVWAAAADAPVAPWIDRGLHPGSDVHDLKYAEALVAGTGRLPESVAQIVRASATAGGLLAPPSPWPTFEAAAAELDALGRP